MAETDTLESLVQWGVDNQHLKGSPEFEEKSRQYKQLRDGVTNAPIGATATAPAAPPSSGESMWDRVKLGFGITPPDTSAGRDAASVSIDDIMAAKRLTSDPRSVSNRADRVLAGAIGGIPDLGIAGWNAGARFVGSPQSQADYLTPKMLANAGVPDLPADAPWYERMGEAAGSAFLGGGAGAAGSVLQNARTAAATAGTAVPRFSTNVRMAAPTVVPTVTGSVGGDVGAALGRNYLGDEETGRLIGSLLGGSAFAVAPAARSLVHQWYEPQAGPNAPAVAAAARNQGVTPTAGMLGNDNILRREQVYSGMPGSADVVQNARTTARAQIGDAYNQAAEARGSVDISPTAGTIGDKVNVAARESADALRAASNARQVALQDRIGSDTPVNVSPIFQRGYDMMADPTANLTPSARRAIDYRLTNELMPLVNRNAAGDPIPPPGIGHNAGPPMSGETAQYGDVRGFRTELGQAIDTPAGGRMPAVSALYEPTTSAMRDTAAERGVTPQNFNTVQNMTRAIERTTPAQPGGPIGDYPTLLRYINEDPAKAFNYLNTGRQNPNIPGILEATGHPLIGQIFGDLIRKVGNETINHPQAGARGPANLDNAWSSMHPESRDTILGPQAGNVGDTVALARALNVSTSQGGLTRALGGQNDAAVNKVIGSEVLGQAGGNLLGPIGAILGRIAGVFGPSGYRGMKAGVMEGPTAINALSGGASPGGINQLAAALAAIQANQQQHGTPGVP